jgi:anti-sigma B factor antagonist
VKTLDVRTATREDGSAVVALDGELDIATTAMLESELEKVEGTEPATLVIDLREVRFIDSTGLRALVAADYRAREAGRRVAIVRGSAAVERVFNLTRLDESLELIDSPDSLTQA